MQYEVEVAGRIRQVRLRRTAHGFIVSVDGRESTVDVARLDANTLSLLLGTSSYEVTVVPDKAAGQLRVGVGSMRMIVALNGGRRAGRTDDAGRGTGPERVVAPMPGKIVRVLVKPGEPVRPRQPLVVIEAMKMENELTASREGAVSDILVKEGQSVDVGTLLLVVTPE